MPAETEASLWLSCRQGRDGCSTVITPTLRRSRSFLLLRAENELKKEDSLQPTGITAHSRFTYVAYLYSENLYSEKLHLASVTN